MTRLEWLKKRHKELDYQVSELEQQREVIRSAEHKAMLVDLKKQRLAVKTEMLELYNN
jgi:uncharacterized protein YdcH (DUF465 family)